MALGSDTEQLDLSLGDVPVARVDKIQHLGITRGKDWRGKLNIDSTITDRISLARGTSYALMGAGLYGLNGISPVISTNIYKVYVVTRLLYGLETLTLLGKHIGN